MTKTGCVGAIMVTLLCSPAANAEPVLTVSYSLPSNFKPALEEIARRFEAEHPDVRIKMRAPLASFDDVVNDLLKSKLTGGAPDIAFVGLSHAGLVAERGLAVPLDQLVQKEGGWSKLGYYSSILSLGAVAGRQYGVPFGLAVPVLHVNVDLVRRAGGSMDNFPSDWNGIADLGQKISALDSKLAGFTFQYDAYSNWTLQALIRGAGGRMEAPHGCGIGFDSPEGRWALETLQLFHDKGMPAMSWQQVLQAFSSGTIGISAASSASISRLETQIKTAFEYRTLPFPMTSADGKLPAGGHMVIVSTSDPEKEQAAWDYVKFATGPAAQTIMVQNSGLLPISQRAAEDPALLGSFYKSHPNQAVALGQMSRLTDWYMWPGPNGLKITSVIQDHVDTIVTGKASARETIPKLAAAVSAMLPPCKAAAN
ncbi:extracellular solute-binding protein [Bradyrhizobium sp. B120]|uniref:extracellular solute-binding protein n=1 Tax=Bradyrhizobium sp. B120 TaxID=3410088 RepID=UPI003B97D7D4